MYLVTSSRFLRTSVVTRRFQTQAVQRDVNALLVIGSRHIIRCFLYLSRGIPHGNTKPAVLQHIDIYIVVAERHCPFRTQAVMGQQLQTLK